MLTKIEARVEIEEVKNVGKERGDREPIALLKLNKREYMGSNDNEKSFIQNLGENKEFFMRRKE